jgi:hypothetical protein
MQTSTIGERKSMLSQRTIISISIFALLTSFGVSAAAVAYTLLAFTPAKLGPAGLTFWFIAILISIGSIIALLSFIWKLRREEHRLTATKALTGSLRTGFLVGFTVAILLALSSLRSLSVRDIILFILVVVVIEIYFRTRKKKA